MINYGYNVCFLDILGFSNKISKEGGLIEIKEKYIKLTEIVIAINEKYKDILSTGFGENSYATLDDNVGVFYKTNIIYGSDSIVIWADRTWEPAKKIESIEKVHFAAKWIGFPKPCDPFIDICNEIICASIELDLPLRGALSSGNAYFDFDKYIFIGKPIVEATQLEKIQDIVGATFCKSFEEQIIPKRFFLTFDNYLKVEDENCKKLNKEIIKAKSNTNMNLLDWPRHWRNTRTKNLIETIEKIDFGTRVDIKANTLRFIEKSTELQDMYLSKEETNIKDVYSEAYANCGLSIRLINA
ncbi:MAG: hypothetical protein PHR83_17955 [Paludibacter sp.]|nr:hypothetical protein [Paludibacter sp.]